MNILAVTGLKLLTIVQLFLYILKFCLDTIQYYIHNVPIFVCYAVMM